MIFDRLKNIVRSNVHDILNSEEEFDFERRVREARRRRVRNNIYEEENADHSNIDEMYEREFGAGSSASSEPQPDPEERKHYAALELPYGASFEQVKTAYKKLVKKYHPDRFPNNPEKQKAAEELTQKINGAYTFFKNKNKK